MPRIVESRFKQAAEAKKAKNSGTSSQKRTHSASANATANESSFSASKLGIPSHQSTPALKRQTSKLKMEPKSFGKMEPPKIKRPTTVPLNRTVNDKLKAETTQVKEDKRAKKVIELAQMVKINQIASRKISHKKLLGDIGSD